MATKKSVILLFLCFSMLTACAGQQRGMVGSSFVSSSHPAIEVSVPDLPLRTAGFAMPSVTTGDSLPGVPVSTWLAVYGGTTLEQPMAIVALAEAPTTYYWDSDLYPVFSADQGVVNYDEHVFYASTFIVDGQRDAFVTLLPTDEHTNQKFIARRFAQRGNFDISKVTLEYREQLPNDVGTISNLVMYDPTYVHDFENRAYNAFRVKNFQKMTGVIADKYLQNVQIRFINTNFLGTLSRLDTMPYY